MMHFGRQKGKNKILLPSARQRDIEFRKLPLNDLKTSNIGAPGGGGGMGLAATTWVPMGTRVPVLSPNDHPNPSQGQ